MNNPPLDCLTVVHEMWDFLDQELTPARWEQVRLHLATCTGCREHVDFCRAFLARLHEIPVAPTDVEELRARVVDALRTEASRPG